MVFLRFFLIGAALTLVPASSTQKIGEKTGESIKASAGTQKTEHGKKGDDRLELTEVRFNDESVVRMSILQEHLEIVTKYGKLTVPTADIMKIDFGVHIPEDLERKSPRPSTIWAAKTSSCASWRSRTLSAGDRMPTHSSTKPPSRRSWKSRSGPSPRSTNSRPNTWRATCARGKRTSS